MVTNPSRLEKYVNEAFGFQNCWFTFGNILLNFFY